jgi:glycosyltransferase involved in cell wall biosynthesis
VLTSPLPTPAVCFIIPTYNRADALKQCLEHIELQTCTDFEVIIIDDGSTDTTPQVLEQFTARGTLRLRHLRQPNSGPAVARNLAISLTRAPLALIIGDDILVAPDFVAVHLQFQRENPELNIASLGLTRWCETRQTVTPFMRWLESSGSQFAYQDLLRGDPPEWRHFYTSNLGVKTQLLRENPFNERFSKSTWVMEDMELGYRLQTQHGLKIVFLPNALADHVHPTDFRKACRRAFGAGRSSRLFDELWPERPVPQHGAVHRAVRQVLCWVPWLAPPLTWFTDTITRFWCPNPLLHPVLAYHVALGRRSRD